jgi:hypothetical protein
LLQADRQTVRIKGIFSFRYFAYVTKKYKATVFKHHTLTVRGEVKAKLHLFLTSLVKKVCGTRRGGRNPRKYDQNTTRKPEEC